MPSLSNYICVKCEKEMRPKKNGIWVEEHSGYDNPYKIWRADLWYCPNCNTEIISGFGFNEVSEHFETDEYDKLKEKVTHHIRERSPHWVNNNVIDV